MERERVSIQNETKSTLFSWLGIALGLAGLVGSIAYGMSYGSEKVPEGVVGALLVSGFISLVVLCASIFGVYDATPIPDEVIPAPQTAQIVTDEVWRARTNFRFLEELKKSLKGDEERAIDLYEVALESHRKLPDSSGYVEYKMLRRTVTSNTARILYLKDKIAEQKEHIERVFAGDVRVDLLDFEERIEKLEREKEESLARRIEEEASIKSAKTPNAQYEAEARKKSLSQDIKHFDMRMIELRSRVKELREFDFQNLYKELGVSPEVMRTNMEDLDSVRGKQDVAATFRASPPIPPPAKQKSKEEIRAEKLSEIEGKIKKLEEDLFEVKNNPTLSEESKTQLSLILDDKLHKMRRDRLDLL